MIPIGPAMSTETPRETHKFQAEVNELLKLVIGSLYSHKEIFLRELVSNASDAIDKLRFRAIAEPELLEGEPALEIRLTPDDKAGTLTIEDTGVGMTHAELVENLGTIAHSGSKAFIERIAHGDRKDLNLIGQFGVGFYSAYLVADRVEVVSRAAGSEHAFRWTSEAKDSFTVEPAERATRGTSIILHLKEDQKKYLDDWELRELVRRYSDYVSHPIKLRADEGKELETVNRASALWQRSPSEITAEQYEEFYKHSTHDFEKPLAWTHFKIEGSLLFAGILFIPRKPPFDLFNGQSKRGVRLFAKRVFIMEDCEELVPQWLRFIRGVVDSDDLPLNVSREILQDSAVVRTIRKQVIKKTLDRLEELAEKEPADYATFWKNFGVVLKEGLATEAEYRDRIAELVRFASTHGNDREAVTSLAEYVARMPEGQGSVYYAIGESRAAVADSPYLEALKKRGYEVLLLTDPVDEWAIDALEKYKDKPLVSAMRADLKIDEGEKAEEQQKAAEGELGPLCERIQTFLKEKVQQVRVSSRLTDSPVCLVVPEGAHHAQMEQLLKAAGRPTAAPKRIFEINPDHALIKSLRALNEREPGSAKLGEWVETLYDQAVLMEGGRIDDPNRFARRITSLLQELASQGGG
jgi:molecular chaperone HtpG